MAAALLSTAWERASGCRLLRFGRIQIDGKDNEQDRMASPEHKCSSLSLKNKKVCERFPVAHFEHSSAFKVTCLELPETDRSMEMTAKQRKELVKAIASLYQPVNQYFVHQDNTPTGWIDILDTPFSTASL